MINRLFALIMSLLFTFMGSPAGTVNTGSDINVNVVEEETYEEEDTSQYTPEGGDTANVANDDIVTDDLSDIELTEEDGEARDY